MKLRFEAAQLPYSVNGILQFIGPEQSSFWSAPFFHFYPDINQGEFQKIDVPERRQFLLDYFSEMGERNPGQLERKQEDYSAYWSTQEYHIVTAFQDTFEENLADRFNDMVCRITYNPICPRYLSNRSFDIFYQSSPQGAVGLALHEITHFLWFDLWQQLFRDNPEEYETPHLKWILSEMVVHPILGDERLASINPYYQNRMDVYPYFFTMEIEGKCILDTLDEMYHSLDIRRFMEESYYYCRKHEAQIRKHIQSSEGI